MKDFLTVLSLANLCFFGVWSSVLYPSFNGYHLDSPPNGLNAIALVLDVLILAAIIWLVFVFARRKNNRYLTVAARFGFIFLAATGLYSFIKSAFGTLTLPAMAAVVGKPAAIAIVVGVISAALYSLVVWPRQMARGLRKIVILASPLILLTFFLSAVLAVRYGSEPTEAVPAVMEDVTEQPIDNFGSRIVWIIFDEFDYRAAFPSRPSDLELPEIDRLAKESFFATNAHSPSGWTLKSLPSLLTGKLVAEAKEKSFDELDIRFADSDKFVDWKTQPNIFSTLNDGSGRLAIAGWYHPYCRLFKNEVQQCVEGKRYAPPVSDKPASDVLANMDNYFFQMASSIPVIKDLSVLVNGVTSDKEFAESSEYWNEQAAAAAKAPQFSFVFLHIPAAHAPYLYDRITGQFDYRRPTNYFDGLALIDDVLGDVRRNMEESGVWDKSVVIVSSDHWWRNLDGTKHGAWSDEEKAVAAGDKDFRVPFIIKPVTPEGENADPQMKYTPMFNTVLTHDLILAMRRGDVSTSGDIAAWLDSHRTIGRTEY